ncbi:toll/interleukin-1 receptor domain-containing protein [Micromonospora zamorensis]|uniref:TIR domain-containing protein n=1 Tax=Micromonospora zamorensis TaxID=709883 RepID=UPI0038668F95|nr:toll/interleukin-1 receptor domain-containing protein [Micromonospora zamorensis]
MKIFVSWSGEPSRSLAKGFSKWLRMVVQQADPWMSDEGIQSGTRWNDAIARSLRDTNFGILCVTRRNQSAPWLLFEAGALAKGLDGSHVVPMCIDLVPSDLDPGPLTSFQARSFGEADVRRLVHEINEVAGGSLPNEQLDQVFDALWPKLEAQVREAREAADAAPEQPRRTTEDMLAEIVNRVREIQRTAPDQHDIARLEESAVILDRLFDRIPRLMDAAEALNYAANNLATSKML